MSRFPTTQWTLIVGSESRESSESREALARLCEAYWKPLYAFVRMKGYRVEDAQDLVQGFFASFLSRDYLKVVDRNRGRFRSYLLGALNHYMSDERDRARAKKRGGGLAPVPLDLDFEGVERQYDLQADDVSDPERVYDRKWALALLARVLDRLHDEYERVGQGDRFTMLIPLVTREQDRMSYREAGRRLDIDEGTARVAAHRLKQRYKQAIREEVAATVVEGDDVDEELRHLMRVLTG